MIAKDYGILKDKECPCCNKVITFNDYIKQIESLSEFDNTKSIICPYCGNIVISKKEITNYRSLILIFVVILFTFISIIFLSYEQIAISMPFVTLIWGLMHRYIPYILAKVKCYDQDVK